MQDDSVHNTEARFLDRTSLDLVITLKAAFMQQLSMFAVRFFFICNPLVIIHVIATAHNDSLESPVETKRLDEVTLKVSLA